MLKVKVFIDYSNFQSAWDRAAPNDKLDWTKLQNLILTKLTQVEHLADAGLDYRGTHVYASVDPRKPRDDVAQWLRFDLDQMPGYTVKFSERQLVKTKCNLGHESSRYVEKGVDTRIACDLLANAIRDAYDVAVLISNDSDLIPSVECVQDVLDRRIVHAGLDDACQYIRSASWAHIQLSDSIEELRMKPALVA